MKDTKVDKKMSMSDAGAASDARWQAWLTSYRIRRDRILKVLGIERKRFT